MSSCHPNQQLLAEFAILPDSRKLTFLQLHPELNDSNVVDAYFSIADGDSQDPVRELNVTWSSHYPWDKLSHYCRLIAIFAENRPLPGCFCGVNTRTRGLLTALYLSVVQGDRRRELAARTMLWKDGLLHRTEVDTYPTGPMSFSPARTRNGPHSLALSLGRAIIRVYQAGYDNFRQDFVVAHHYGCDPRLPLAWFGWKPAPVFPALTTIQLPRGLHFPTGSIAHAVSRLRQSDIAFWGGDPRDSDSQGHDLETVALHPNGRLLVAALHAGLCHTAVALRGFRLLTEDPPVLAEVFRLNAEFGADMIAFSPDGNLLAAQNSMDYITVWNLRDADGMPKLRRVWGSQSSVYGRFMFLPGNRFLVWELSGHEVSLVMYDTTSWSSWRQTREVHQMQKEGAYDHHVAFSRDGRIMAIGFEGASTVGLWDINAGQKIGSFDLEDPISCDPAINRESEARKHSRISTRITCPPAFSPDGRHMAIGTERGAVLLADLNTGNTHALQGHSHSVSRVSFSPDGLFFVSASWDSSLVFWRVVRPT